MNRSYSAHFALLFLACYLALFISQASGQVKVTRLTSPDLLSGGKGIVYALPRSVVAVDLTVTKVQQYPGPLAEYSREFLGLSDVVIKSAVEYHLDGAVLRTIMEPDPGQTYLIEKEEKSQGEIWIAFGPDGKSITMGSFPKESSPKGFSEWDNALYTEVNEAGLYSMYSASATRESIDTITRKVSIDTLVIEETILKRSLVEYPDRDKAQDAMDRINRIESDIYNLLIGYQETAYSKEAIEFMYNRLQAERQEYISLFTGVTVKERLVFHFRVIPDPSKESREYIITGFSETNGLVEPNAENKISLVLAEEVENQPISDESIGQATKGVVYRIPAVMLLKLYYRSKEIVSDSFEILQFGSLLAMPPEFKKFELNLETGSIRSVVME